MILNNAWRFNIICFSVLNLKIKRWFCKSIRNVFSNFRNAFCRFVRTCLIKNINSNCNIAAFVIILMLSKCKKFSLSFFSMFSKSSFCYKCDDELDHQIFFENINSEITLNCNSQIISFLLCNNFFEISVFCNFLNAHFLKTSNVFQFLKNESRTFRKLIIKRLSTLYFFESSLFKMNRVKI